MTFYHREYKKLDMGATRVIEKFLWWPRRIGSITKWLEWAYIRQIAHCGVIGAHGDWEDYEWVYDTNQILESEKNLENR